MTYLIQRILKLANKVCPNLIDNMMKSNYQLLINLMCNLKANDLNFDQSEIDRLALNQAPCAYVRLFENQNFNLSIFSIRPGSRLPLHNHPQMHGIIKVISGKIVIKNFDLLEIEEVPKNITNLVPFSLKSRRLIPVKQLDDKVISSDDQNVAIVEPESGNIHEITVSPDCRTGSAFLDLLSPPYNSELPERSATYYEIIGESFSYKLATNITWLIEVPSPIDYWCIHAPYLGPELSDKILEEDK